MSKITANITGVSLCQKTGTIRIFRSTIKELSDPKYIRFLFNPEKRTLAVQAAKRKEAEWPAGEYIVSEKDRNAEKFSFSIAKAEKKAAEEAKKSEAEVVVTNLPGTFI